MAHGYSCVIFENVRRIFYNRSLVKRPREYNEISNIEEIIEEWDEPSSIIDHRANGFRT